MRGAAVYIALEWLTILAILFMLGGLLFLASCAVLILQGGARFLARCSRNMVERAGTVPTNYLAQDKPRDRRRWALKGPAL